MKADWFEFTFDTKRRVPKWARRAVVTDDGTLYVPAVLGGNELGVILCAGYDGTRLISDMDHIYAPAEWLRREYPKTENAIRNIERAVRDPNAC